MKGVTRKARSGRTLSAWDMFGLAKIGTITLARLRVERQCSATAKRTGQRCRQIAVTGKNVCHLHGGKTPSGPKWHLTQWPRPDDPRAMEKVHAKLQTLARHAKARDRWLAALDPARRAAYAKWVKSHRPGPAGPRKAAKAEREANAWARAQHEKQTTTKPDPELDSIEAEIARLEKLLADEKAKYLAEFDALA